MGINKLLGQPNFVKDAGIIYPVKLKNYDFFTFNSDFLYISKKNFEETELPLLLLIIKGLEASGVPKENAINKIKNIYGIVSQSQVSCLKCNNEFDYENIVFGNEKEICPYCYSD